MLLTPEFTNALRGCHGAVLAGNTGEAKELFGIALDAWETAPERLREVDGLLWFFACSLKEQTAEVCAGLFDMMRERKMEYTVGVLDPIVTAVKYWKTEPSQRAEILDRLNPEIREVVEDIIAGKRVWE